VACREVAKHFKCPYMTGHSVTPDGAIVLEDGTVVAICMRSQAYAYYYLLVLVMT